MTVRMLKRIAWRDVGVVCEVDAEQAERWVRERIAEVVASTPKRGNRMMRGDVPHKG